MEFAVKRLVERFDCGSIDGSLNDHLSVDQRGVVGIGLESDITGWPCRWDCLSDEEHCHWNKGKNVNKRIIRR